ncbi:MAG: threonine--tRNA ligase [Candidatus Omnitrophica bacterium CG22_combo_CG10-13_8_21_14_all_43_16]|nr:MAG: threonine--tRNA ligase [Candidatus Omnitrophica bacterium CG22_combo_CG10-13_8_21_14_all_43_16]
MKDNLDALRHSSSHVMADAVKRLFPDSQLAIGPAIEDGFYYDFDRKEPFKPEDLAEIEKEMAKIIKEDLEFKREEVSKKEAAQLFKKLKETYKLELIEKLEGDTVSIYRHGKFVDLCKGPHVKSTGEIKAFKLLSIAGAYWHGIETNPMLQRIYGTCFETTEALEGYLKKQEEAKKRDHRKLGKELDLFSIHDEVGPGLVFYHPKGALLRMLIEDYEKKEHLKRGYQIVMGPHILKSDIWITSGHYEYYKDNMYIFKTEGEEYVVKPMNCPGHMLIYKSKLRSYKDLPIRYFELGNVHRREKTGVLHGLLRVRGFTQDDAHIFCLPGQLEQEIIGVIDFVIDTMKVFGFNDYKIDLSTRPPKSIGTDEIWSQATSALKNALESKGMSYGINEGEGAFYGPKIDIMVKDALGRPWQCATIQCDFALPERFDLTYISADGKKERPVMLHRVILGSMERFMGTLIEHYAGAFPVWLAPVQAAIIPITDRSHDYADNIFRQLQNEDIRVEVDKRNEKLQYKIRESEMNKIPYMLIIGDKEKEAGTVSVRARKEGDIGAVKIEEFIARVKKEIKNKCS